MTSTPLQRLALAGVLAALTLMMSACERSPKERVADAKRMLDNGDPVSAGIELKNVLKNNPGFAEGRYLLGQSLLQSGDALGAESELRRALAGGFNPDKVTTLLAEVLVGLQRFKPAIELASAEPKDPADYSQLKTQLAIALMATGKLPEAQTALDASLRKSPGHALTLDVMARLKAATGDSRAAGVIVDELVQSRPNDPAMWSLKGDILVQSKGGSQAEAEAAYRKALALQPKFVEAHAGLIGLSLNAGKADEAAQRLQQMKTVRANHPQTRFFEALLSLQKQDTGRARELAQGLIKLAPDNPRLQMLAGQTEMQSGSYVQAETHLTKAVLLATDAREPRYALTELYLRMGHLPKARETLAPLLASQYEDAELLSLAGRAQLLSGDTAAAELAFKKAAQLAPNDLRNRTGLAVAQLGRGQADAGVAALEAIAKDDKGTQADLQLINTRLQRKDYAAALAAIDRLAAKLPTEAYPDLLRGQIAARQGKAAQARKHWEAALQRAPNYLAALVALAELDIAEGKPESATVALRAAVKRQPKNAGLRAALADFVSRTGGSKAEVVALMKEAIAAQPQDARPRTDLVGYALNIADHALALTMAQDAAAALPANEAVLERLGQAQLASGETRQALTTFAKLNALLPNAPEPLMQLASAQLVAENMDAAWANAKKAADMAPNLPEAQRLAVDIAIRSGRHTEALAIARATQKRVETQAGGWLLEAQIEQSRGNTDAAIAAFRKAHTRLQDSDSASMLHAALVLAKKPADAEQFANARLKAFPKDLAFLLHLGIAAQQQKDEKLAEQRYRQMLEIQPNNLEALNNLAQLLAMQKKPGAVALAKKVNELAPNRAPLMDTLAASFASEGKLKPAIELQSRVVALSPDQADFRLTLAKLQLEAGDREAARLNLTKLSKYGPEFANKAEALRLLKSLGG